MFQLQRAIIRPKTEDSSGTFSDCALYGIPYHPHFILFHYYIIYILYYFIIILIILYIYDDTLPLFYLIYTTSVD